MPSVTNGHRTSAAAAKPRKTASASAAAATTTPKKGKVVRRNVSSPRGGGAGAAAPPVNMRELSQRNVQAVCDAVSVASRFDSRSRCSAVAPDTTVWTGETDGTVVIRLAPSGLEVSRVKAFGKSTVLVLANVAGRMWAGYSDGAIRVFDHATQKVLRESTQHTAAVYAMCAADGFVYTGGADWKVYQWEADDLHFCRMYHGHRNNVRCLTTYTDPESSRRYVVSGSDDGTVKVWDASVAATPMKRAGRTVGGAAAGDKADSACVATLEAQGRAVLCALVLEDTAELWVGSEDAAIRVWDLYSMTVTSVIAAHRTPVVTLQRVEETVWSGSKDGMLVIVNRFSKDVVHQATQPPMSTSSSSGSGSAGGPQQRFNMSIQPVTRTVVYNVWASTPDGAWQCWHFAAPEGSAAAATAGDGAVGAYMDGHYLSQSRNARSADTSQRRTSVRNGYGAESEHGASAVAATSSSSFAEAPLGRNGTTHAAPRAEGGAEEAAELRESVARTRRSVTVLVTEPAESPADAKKKQTKKVGGDDDVDADADAGSDVEDAPVEALAESIQNDHTEETKREVEQQQAALEREEQRAERLRAMLQQLGQDPAAVAAAAESTTAKAQARRSSLVENASTAALEDAAAKLSALKAENAAMKAAIEAARS